MKFIIYIISLLLITSCSFNGKTTKMETEKNSDDIKELKSYVSNHKIKIDALYESKKENQEIINLNEKITLLEKRIETLQNDLAIKQKSSIIRVNQNNTETFDNETNLKINYEEIYNSARQLYLEQKFDDALNAFRNFIIKYPENDLAANCQYWTGEVFYDQELYNKAIKEFQKVVDFYSSSAKAPDAQLKIALCYKQLNQPKQAILELSRIEKMYPNYEKQKLVNDFINELE